MSKIAMDEATRDPEPTVKYDVNAGWDEANKAKDLGKSTMSQDFESTDTPDFYDPDDPYSQRASEIKFTDGLGGSAKEERKPHNPGLEGALDVNPDIYMPDQEVFDAEADGVVFELKKSGMIDLELEMFTIGGDDKDLDIPIKPVAMTFEPFYAGFTKDSHPAFTCTPTDGKMERRNGDHTIVTVNCNPGNAKGELVGYLCFILPEEKDFSSYYKITCQSR